MTMKTLDRIVFNVQMKTMGVRGLRLKELDGFGDTIIPRKTYTITFTDTNGTRPNGVYKIISITDFFGSIRLRCRAPGSEPGKYGIEVMCPSGDSTPFGGSRWTRTFTRVE